MRNVALLVLVLSFGLFVVGCGGTADAPPSDVDTNPVEIDGGEPATETPAGDEAPAEEPAAEEPAAEEPAAEEAPAAAEIAPEEPATE